MKTELHTVLGADGAIGKAVLKELEYRQLPARAVSKSKISQHSQSIQANLLNLQAATLAIQDSSYVYLCAGLPYSSKIWEDQWQRIMTNVIESCAKNSAKLIFFDNVYMYSAPLPIPFDENTLQKPGTRKGKVRKHIADLLMNAVVNEKLEGLVARSADFYGKYAINSHFYISFLERMLQGKDPWLLFPGDINHTYANVSDNGRALVTLALCDDCYGQVWHLPTSGPIKMNEVLLIFNHIMETHYKLKVLPKSNQKFLSMFISVLKEIKEMSYQFEKEYIMCSDKFINKFPNFKVTSYEKGIEEMVQSFRNNN